MDAMSPITTLRARLVSVALGAALLAASQLYGAEMMTKSGSFKGPKANTGFVTHAKDGGKLVLTLSDDFKTPDTPDPHWQVVDSKGAVYMLQKISITRQPVENTRHAARRGRW